MLKRWDFLEKATAENLLPIVSTLDTLNQFTYDPAWFLPSYPPISSNDFMIDIVTKKEFWDTEDAIYLDHQVRIARYLDEHSVYDSLLLFHEPGTGKSSVAIALMDLLKSSSSPFQHGMVLFVANNMTILNNFRDQIRKRSVLCRDRILFLTSEISNPERRAQRQNELWTTVFNFFDIRFYTYHQLAKKMDEEGGQSLLLQQLSYSILIMDESHHLHYQKSGTQGERTYWNLHRLLHSLPKKRLLLLTGTPIQDQPEEIALLWNLMLPMDQQIPTGKEFVKKYLEVTQTIEVANLSTDPDDLQEVEEDVEEDVEEVDEMEDVEKDIQQDLEEDVEEEEKQSEDTAVSFPTVELVVYQWKEKEKMELAEILKGRNSFLKQSVGDVRIQYRGILVTPMVSLPLEADRMSQFQSFYYLKGIEGDLRNTGKKKEKSYKNSVQSTLFVFPDGSSGERGFSRFVDYSLPKKKGGDDLASAVLFRKFTLKLKESAWGKYTDLGRWKSAMTPVGEKIRFISEFSSIYGKFLEEFLAPENLLKKAYAYSFLVKGSGIMLLLLILQEFFGFEIITNASPKVMDTKTPKNRLLFINDAVRTPDGDVQEMLRFFNQPDNKNGKLCRLVLSTNKTTEGISLFHIRQVHILTPAWNLSEISQAIARGIREGSHKGLENPTVDIFLHCAFPVVSSPGKGDDDSSSSSQGRLTGVEKNFSIDFQRYVRSEIKDRNMTLVQRFVMTTSWDCVFNAERNKKNRVEDGSKDCDYQECEYSCWPWERPSGVEQAVTLDPGNASLWYDEKLYGQMENHLRTFFRRQTYTTGTMLYEYLLERVEEMTPFEFLTFVSEWIEQKMVLYTIFGTACVLQYEAPYYFVVGYIPGCTNLPLDNIPLEMYAQRPLVAFSSYATPQQMVETDWASISKVLSNLTGIHQEIHRMVMILVSNKPVEYIKKAEKRLSILVQQFPPGLRGDVFETYWMAFYTNRKMYLDTKKDLPKLLALYELLLIFQRVFDDARVDIVFGSHPQKRWEEFYKHPEAVPTASHSFLVSSGRRRRFEVDSETWVDEEEVESAQVQQAPPFHEKKPEKTVGKKTKKKPKVVKEMKKLLPEEEMSRQDLDRYIFENPVGYYMYKKDRLLYFRDVEDKDLYRTKDRKKIPAGRACSNMKMGDILYIMLVVFRFMGYSSTFDEKILVHLKKYKTEEEMRLWAKKPREELEEMFMRAGSFPKFIQHFPLPEGIESVEDPRFVPGVMGSITDEELEYLIIIMQLVINTELCPLMMEIFKEMSLFREADTTVMRRSSIEGEKETVGGGVEESKTPK